MLFNWLFLLQSIEGYKAWVKLILSVRRVSWPTVSCVHVVLLMDSWKKKTRPWYCIRLLRALYFEGGLFDRPQTHDVFEIYYWFLIPPISISVNRIYLGWISHVFIEKGLTVNESKEQGYRFTILYWGVLPKLTYPVICQSLVRMKSSWKKICVRFIESYVRGLQSIFYVFVNVQDPWDITICGYGPRLNAIYDYEPPKWRVLCKWAIIL